MIYSFELGLIMPEQCSEDGCSHINFVSDTRIHSITIPVIVSKQNAKYFYSTSLSIEQIMKFSDIPALDSSLNAQQEAEYTANSMTLIAGGGVPSRWQRASKRSRIMGGSGIGSWLSLSGNNTMPDGILLGINQEHNENVVVGETQTIIGGREIREIIITQTLSDGCAVCGPYTNPHTMGVQYKNRCTNHLCTHHSSTTAPLVIIDGQHRTLGLNQAGIENKDVTVSLLPISNLGANPGFSIRDQAVIFEQVNSKGEDLNKEHQLWLKRMFGNWSTAPAVDGRKAYDLLAQLGHQSMTLPTPSIWRGKIRMIGADASNCHIDSPKFATGEGTGKILQTGPMESVIASLETASTLSGQTKADIASNWLEAWRVIAPARFTGGLFDTDETRPFAALVRTMHITLERMSLAGVTTFNLAAFNTELMAYTPNLLSINWDRFVEGSVGEPSQKNLYNCLGKMVSSGGATGPTWQTMAGPAGAISWEDWIMLAPDPLVGFSHPTLLLTCSQPDGITTDLDSGNARAIVGQTASLGWEAPVNVGKHPTGSWRSGGNWATLKSFGTKISNGNDICSDVRACNFDLSDAGNLTRWLTAATPGDQWDLRIEYSSSTGTITEIIVGFVVP